jgi:hypothetical protein
MDEFAHVRDFYKKQGFLKKRVFEIFMRME